MHKNSCLYGVACISFLFLTTGLTYAAQPCAPGKKLSEQRCAGRQHCVDIEVSDACDENNPQKMRGRFHVDARNETVEIVDVAGNNLTFSGSKRWKYELHFFRPDGSDVTELLVSSDYLTDDCTSDNCDYQLKAGGLANLVGASTLKYSIMKHKKASHGIAELDPSVIIKPQ